MQSYPYRIQTWGCTVSATCTTDIFMAFLLLNQVIPVRLVMVLLPLFSQEGRMPGRTTCQSLACSVALQWLEFHQRLWESDQLMPFQLLLKESVGNPWGEIKCWNILTYSYYIELLLDFTLKIIWKYCLEKWIWSFAKEEVFTGLIHARFLNPEPVSSVQ